ncbi:Arc family DNA-binding protein [Acetobacter indonesiensis]|uniref:Arc family DNA-binding protein n=1 Tax=Acetobacter indonesiensis TaxID=104101 RepID=UPI000A3C9FC7|nr:Arc family DNA-binding protein [Acetobacter indonesiensis]
MKQRHDDPQFKFRMPPDMKGALEECAKRNKRTLTAEILTRLDASLSQRAIPDVPETVDMNADERSLVRMWRAMNEGERLALRAVAERLADKAEGKP